MIDSIGRIMTVACTIMGAVTILAGLIWLNGWLIFQASDMVLKVLKLKDLFVGFIAEQHANKHKVYTPSPEEVDNYFKDR